MADSPPNPPALVQFWIWNPGCPASRSCHLVGRAWRLTACPQRGLSSVGGSPALCRKGSGGAWSTSCSWNAGCLQPRPAGSRAPPTGRPVGLFPKGMHCVSLLMWPGSRIPVAGAWDWVWFTQCDTQGYCAAVLLLLKVSRNCSRSDWLILRKPPRWVSY